MGPKHAPKAVSKKAKAGIAPRKSKPQTHPPPVTIPLSIQQHILNIFDSLLTSAAAAPVPSQPASVTQPDPIPSPSTAASLDVSALEDLAISSAPKSSTAPSKPNAQTKAALLTSLRTDIQQVKQHLYARAFDQAFGSARLLRAYAIRWSPTRALAYHELIHTELAEQIAFLQANEPGVQRTILCIGAGAGAELVAFNELLPSTAELRLVDMAPWSPVLTSLQDACREAEHSNRPVSSSFSFTQQDVLALDAGQIAALAKEAGLVTLLFTLNELYATSRAKTTGFLLALGAALKPGATLLVVDSPGDYSTVDVGPQAERNDTKEKMYPMRWLLDHTLLEVANGPEKGATMWEKVYGNESRWFRVPAALRYPLELENMRYQAHVYVRT